MHDIVLPFLVHCFEGFLVMVLGVLRYINIRHSFVGWNCYGPSSDWFFDEKDTFATTGGIVLQSAVSGPRMFLFFLELMTCWKGDDRVGKG